MTLREWWAAQPRKGKKELKQSLADACGAKVPAVHNWIFGTQAVPGKYASTVIQFTGYKVTLDDLYADE